MLDLPDRGCGLQVVVPPALPIADLVIGKPVRDVAALVPRIFNLCKTAQSVAVRMALGLPVSESDHIALRAEILREHELRLRVLLPARFGFGAGALTKVRGDMTLDDVMAGPDTDLIQAVRDTFDPGEAVCAGDGDENSVAGAQRHQPLMRDVERRYGRGPLWRLLARYLELARPVFAAPEMRGRWAVVRAARGNYAMRAAVLDGRVTQFARVTPTDAMLAKGGAIHSALATLPRSKRQHAQLVLDIFDPCVPLTLREVSDA